MMFLVVVLLITTLGLAVHAHFATKNMSHMSRRLQEHAEAVTALINHNARIIAVLGQALLPADARVGEISGLLVALEKQYNITVEYKAPDAT